jgi:hypothetical protein
MAYLGNVAHLRHCGEQEVNAVIREQLLLQNCRARSLIVTVQADCVGRISANTHHALSMLHQAAVKLMYGTCDLFVVQNSNAFTLSWLFCEAKGLYHSNSSYILYIAVQCMLKYRCKQTQKLLNVC